MKNGALFLLIILLLGLVLCSVLGGKCSKESFVPGSLSKKISEKTGITTSESSEDEIYTSDDTLNGYNSMQSTNTGSSTTYDNYDHYNGSSYPTTFYGPNGGTASIKNENGKYSLLITNSNGSTTLYNTSNSAYNNDSTNSYNSSSSSSSSITETIFYGPNGGTARVFMGSDGNYVVEITDSNGAKYAYSSNSNNNNNNNNTITQTTYYGPNGGTAVVTKGPNGNAIQYTNPNGEKTVYYSREKNSSDSITSTTFYGPNGGSARFINGSEGQYVIEFTDPNGNKTVYSSRTNTIYKNDSNNNSDSDSYYYNGYNYNYYSDPNNSTSNSNSASAGSVTGPYGNTASYAIGPYGNTVAGVNTQGVPASAIPSGDEDLYILKSQVVPPVCPACPTAASCPRQEPCPACPACARCPEPAFECKKVPNYNNINDNYLPMPVLNDFSTFGM
jgi:hypothetical protein